MAQWVRPLALSLPWLWLSPCHSFHLWPGNFCTPWVWPKSLLPYMYKNVYIYIIVRLFNGLQLCSCERSPVRLLKQVYLFYRGKQCPQLSQSAQAAINKPLRRDGLSCRRFSPYVLWKLEARDHGCWQTWFLVGTLFLACRWPSCKVFPLCM